MGPERENLLERGSKLGKNLHFQKLVILPHLEHGVMYNFFPALGPLLAHFSVRTLYVFHFPVDFSKPVETFSFFSFDAHA